MLVPFAIGLVLGGSVLGTANVAHAQFDTLFENGPSSNRVDIFFFGDGYTVADLAAGIFIDHVQNYFDYAFSNSRNTDPYFRYRKYFNAYTVDVESNESGADVPQLGITRDTALDATYQLDGETDQLLYINPIKANRVLNDALIGWAKRPR